MTLGILRYCSFISPKQIRSTGEYNDENSKANTVKPSPQYRTKDSQLDSCRRRPEHEDESCALLLGHGFISCGPSVSAALPWQVVDEHSTQKRASDPYEHKTVQFDWKALIACGGALWYSIFSHSMEFLGEVPCLRWWTHNRKIAIPPTTPQGGAHRVQSLAM
jgi:hypothetical protein